MEALTPPVTKDTESEVLFEFTFELQKRVHGLSLIFKDINERQESPSSKLLLSLATENSTSFSIKSYETTSTSSTPLFNGDLKSVSKRTRKAIPKFNFAIAYEAKVQFSVADDETHFTASILAPTSTLYRDTIVEFFKVL